MKDILSVIFLLIIGLAPSLIKIIKGEDPKKTSKAHPPRGTTPRIEEVDESSVIDNMEKQKKTSFLRNEPEYFTYERIDSNDESAVENCIKQNVEPLQTIDIEEEKSIDLHFDHDEICKGIIYSEILKRKY